VVVVFVSADYAGLDWTRLERRAAFSRAVMEAGVYMLPARFDDSELPGLLPDVVTVDLRRYTPGQFADLVVAKLAELAISPSSPQVKPAEPPAGGVRVSQVDPRRLGVHAAISVPGYLDGKHGLTGGVVEALLNAAHPAVIIGTLWPDQYTTYATVPAPGGADPHKRQREVLKLAEVIRIAPKFSPAEQGRARATAARDPRLMIALESAGYGLTQTLAAAPQLVARWQDAETASPYAWAVLTAALDAARLGVRAPLSVDFLRAAAEDYCTSQQQAEAPDNWFEQALAYATAAPDSRVHLRAALESFRTMGTVPGPNGPKPSCGPAVKPRADEIHQPPSS
jgi:hypothetical protein